MAVKTEKRPYYRVNMRDVARFAKVSKSTVSRVLRNDEKVSETTRNRVMQAVKELGYKTNSLASGIFSGRILHLGLMIPDAINEFWGRALTRIEGLAFDAGYQLIVVNTAVSADREKISLTRLIEKRVDGMIIVPFQEELDNQHFVELLASGIPFVILDRQFDELKANHVLCDNFDGSYQAARHLIELGHERIANIAGSTHISTGKLRLDGYLAALRDHGLAVPPEYVKVTHFFNFEEYACAATRELLAARPRPTAIMANTDYAALGVFRAVFEAGLRVPEDISVVGFSNLGFAPHLRVPLTTVDQPIDEMSRCATELLLRTIENPDGEKETIMLPTRLVVRDSTGRA